MNEKIRNAPEEFVIIKFVLAQIVFGEEKRTVNEEESG